ncbi:hypothetical protein R3P38DRAFT_3275786 [Favolaschia claudopus]|uniref:Myb/SANT-like domain-containing protein n=1 Tax=Favolaschia claudopus TaxID=2862362 RepID=A0AAW0ASP2_9AGAR
MGPKNPANWTADPNDIKNLLQFFYDNRSRAGEGGNWDKTLLNEAAVYMASLGEPKKGGPKTPQSIETKWREIRKLYEYILQVKQKRYIGASGWTYTEEGGFNVTDEDREAWKDFVKAHPHFKPFATSGWEHFQKVDDIVPSQARGRFVYNPAATQSTPAPPPTTSLTPPPVNSTKAS